MLLPPIVSLGSVVYQLAVPWLVEHNMSTKRYLLVLCLVTAEQGKMKEFSSL
jgi:hypothetical protein